MQPELAALKEQGVDLYVFALGKRSSNEQFFDRLQLEATILYDADMRIADLFAVDAIPQSFFIDRQGRIAAWMLGWGTDSFQREVLPITQALLEEEE